MQPVDGNGAARRQRHPLCADRFALVRQSGDAEEHIGAIGGAHIRSFVRMRGHPVANALRRHLRARNEIGFDEHSFDRAIAITVVRIVADAQRRAVLEDHARRAFNLDCEQIQWILEPADFKLLPVERAGLNGAAVVVRHEFVVLVAAADPHPFVGKCNGAGLVAGSDQITRPAIDRDMEFGTRKTRACNNRLEIAGQKALDFAQARDANRLEIVFEEGASGICIPWPQVYGVTADVPQGAKDLSAIVRRPTAISPPCMRRPDRNSGRCRDHSTAVPAVTTYVRC